MAPRLDEFLSEPEITELRKMAEHSQGWTYLLKLLRALEQVGLRQLSEFKNADDAFEKKGFARGITLCRDVVQNLYNTRVKGAENDSPIDQASRVASVNAAGPDEDAAPRWRY